MFWKISQKAEKMIGELPLEARRLGQHSTSAEIVVVFAWVIIVRLPSRFFGLKKGMFSSPKNFNHSLLPSALIRLTPMHLMNVLQFQTMTKLQYCQRLSVHGVRNPVPPAILGDMVEH